MTVQVLIVDDHPVVRAGLHALVEAHPEITVVGEAADAREAMHLAAETRPDVVLCDLRLGDGQDGVALTQALRATGGETGGPPAVVILTTYDHDLDIVRAVEAGAAGYLLKDADPEEIVGAVLLAARGLSVLSPAMTERVVTSMRTRRAVLSGRELDVIRLVASGQSNREIAKSLFISEATVKTHLAHAFTKLDVDSRTAAAAAARDAGLVD